LKILQVNASYKPAYIYGGPTMSVSKLSEEMTKAGCTVEVFTTAANGTHELRVTLDQPTDVDGVKVTYFKRLTKDHSHFSPSLLKALRKQVRQFDVVHIHAWWNLVSVLSCWTALKKGVPVVISPRGTLSNYSFTNKNNLPKKLIHDLIGKGMLKRSFMHVTSERERAAMEAFGPKKIFAIPNFIALPGDVPPRIDEQNGILKLLFFSRIEKKKGLEILFDALAGINIPYHLTIAGDGEAGYKDELRSLAVKNGISEHLTWIGFQQDHKFDILQQHDLLVLPSYDENFGNVVIESLSAGTAVLISNHVGLEDYVRQSNFGWVCSQDAASFKENIIAIYKQPNELARIRAQAPDKIREDFSEEMLAKRYIEMYRKIIANG
jgi:glycosyltransferase involved in cell wall biosynthesis